jgi:ABC-type bacteriocin/lantibiotic exporter with double-glycine peptidase domain
MTVEAAGGHRRLMVPEVIQISAMDCGPASLKALLEGYGISASYGRLREACQTDVDGTSINTMEEIAVQLGLEAEQIMLPVDHLLLPEAQALPAIVVVRHASNLTHFIIVWRAHGRFVQVMDPAIGRRWLTARQLLNELYVHMTPVPATAWRAWAGTDEFLGALRRRLAQLGLARSARGRLIDAALADPSWHALATLDASTRMVDTIVRAGGLRAGRQAARVLAALCEHAREESTDEGMTIPQSYWLVQPGPPGSDGAEQLLLQGAVLVRVRGRRRRDRARAADEVTDSTDRPAPLSPELVAALEEPPSRPGRTLLAFLRADGLLTPTALATALVLASGGVVVTALLFRAFFDFSRVLGLPEQRLGGMGLLLILLIALLCLELAVASGMLRLGRHLESRLRMAFLQKIPRLSDRYFQGWLTSDMAERSHSVQALRLLPHLGGRLIRSVFELVLTTAGIAWLDPASAPLAALTAVLSAGLPLAAQPLRGERDLRMRSHAGALSRFYLDALLGLVAVRVHAAERAIRREHESLLVEWMRAAFGLQRLVVMVESVQSLIGFGLVTWLLFAYLERGGEISQVLLLVYWAFNLPVLGQQVVRIAEQYTGQRNVTLRLLEPLGAREESDVQEGDETLVHPRADTQAARPPGVAIRLQGVSVRAAGHTILEEIDLTIEAGSHVAIVGQSGAGKSSLVGLLLGWHRPAHGCILIDGEPLQGARLARLRRETAWVDPAVQLWNRSLLENLLYGALTDSPLEVGRVIDQAHLRSVLEKLPDGLQTPLGEGGGLVSGGEGQRVRLGRAMLRAEARLVILDEPFRGLDREQRQKLMARARSVWQHATLLCITHDVSETQAFARVLVVEGGQIVEDGAPRDLVTRPGSHYRALLETETSVLQDLWASSAWRRFELQGGLLHENGQRGHEVVDAPWHTAIQAGPLYTNGQRNGV